MILYKHTNYTGGSMSLMLLKQAIEDYAGRKAIASRQSLSTSYDLLKGSGGKPYLADFPQIQFSVSHSRKLWVCGIQEEALGIDVECPDPGRLQHKGVSTETRFMKIAGRFFAEAEQSYVSEQGLAGFYEIWVRKEAYIKYKGTGISENLGSFSVVSENRLVQYAAPLYFAELLILKGVLGAYCSTVPLAIEAVVSLNL
jgi:phosphopantetheinyl transferase